mmetsp:Transcript_105073/g.295911  ORF Transcript_105073/g.295911 Transcript_105073/m.295911 type:complete len:519 (-) Transcript_105073:53-1609(-)
MSLEGIIAEQQQIAAEQKAIRNELQNLASRLDSQLKGEIQRLVSRIDANDDRIAKLSGGSNGVFGAPRASGKGGGRSAAAGTNQGQRGGYPSATMAPAPAPARSGAFSTPATRSVTAPRSGAATRKKNDNDLALVQSAISTAVRGAEKSDVWEEPAEEKMAPAAIDRFESQIKNALERNREFQKFPQNPIQGVQMIFNKLDRNHSGKVDVNELQELCKLLEFQSDTKALSALFRRYDIDHSGLLTIEEFSRSMFRLDGDIEYKAKSAIARMREVLSLRAGGFESLKAMGNQFRIIDRDHTGQLSKEEFNIALDILFSAYNVRFSQAEKNSLFTQFDFDKSGSISYDEFARAIRGSMSEFRLGWVKQAFSILDVDGSGIVDLRELASTYDVSQNPAVQSGKVTPDDAMRQFMKHYDGNSDGTITLEEFIENYEWVSASIDTDDYWELMMRNAWHIPGGELWCANTANARLLVVLNDGTQKVVTIKNDLGLDLHDNAAVMKALRAQGLTDIAKFSFSGDV